jgi:16S rRNA (cytidine1402-2'-O)-methyltransferase
MSGTLFVVATPIGNLEDITLRALRVLRETDVIAAEDTRRTAKLLAHYAISTPTLSFHQHNTRTRLPQIVSRLKADGRVALVTDAGTPGISDPGVELVRACIDEGIAVDPIPGPSAPIAAAVASGFPLEPLTILGFTPTKAKERRAWMNRLQAITDTVTFFEAPHRIERTLAETARYLGERQIVVAREVTKLHQQFIRGTASTIIGHIPEQRGEFTVVVSPNSSPGPSCSMANNQDIYAEFGRLIETGTGGRRAAVATLAKKHGRSSKEIYAIIENVKRSVE